jgi:hypothetical protein
LLTRRVHDLEELSSWPIFAASGRYPILSNEGLPVENSRFDVDRETQ